MYIERFGENIHANMKNNGDLRYKILATCLPGDHKCIDIKSMLRVNHAGEYGAVRIYNGQISASWFDGKLAQLLYHMKEQEEQHLQYFVNSLDVFAARPSLLHSVWHICGWALGFMTMAAGKNMAMCCTEAVESVIEKHYLEQMHELDHYLMQSRGSHTDRDADDSDAEKIDEISEDDNIERVVQEGEAFGNLPDLRQHIEKFRLEEIEHHDIAQEAAEKSILYRALFVFVQCISKISIAVAKKI